MQMLYTNITFKLYRVTVMCLKHITLAVLLANYDIRKKQEVYENLLPVSKSL